MYCKTNVVDPILFSAGAHLAFVGSVLLLFRIEYELPRFLTVILTGGVLLLELSIATAGTLVGVASIGATTSYTAIGMFVGAVALVLLQ